MSSDADVWATPPASDRHHATGNAALPSGRILIEALVVTGVLAGLAVLGWHAFSPEIFAEVTESGVRVSTAESRREFGIEAWFGVVTGAAGLIAGTWLMLRHWRESVGIQVVLALAGILGTVLVWQFGRGTGPGDLAARASLAEPGTLLQLPYDVTSYALFSIWPIAAIIAGAAVVALRDDKSARWRH